MTGKINKKELEQIFEFWIKKIGGNIERDKKVNETLKSQGWKVLRFWDDEIKKDIGHVVKAIIKSLTIDL